MELVKFVVVFLFSDGFGLFWKRQDILKKAFADASIQKNIYILKIDK